MPPTKPTLEHTLETESLCHSKAIVVRGDSDSLRLQPAFTDLTGFEAAWARWGGGGRGVESGVGGRRVGAEHGRKEIGRGCLSGSPRFPPSPVRKNRAIVP